MHVRGDGLFAIGGELLATDEAALVRLIAFRDANPHAQIHVIAHPATVHGRLVRALELVHRAKIAPDLVDVREAKRP